MKGATQEMTGAESLQPWALALRDEVAAGKMITVKQFSIVDWTVEVRQGQDSLWVFVWDKKNGGFACRTAWSPGLAIDVDIIKNKSTSTEFKIASTLGEFCVLLQIPDQNKPLLRWTASLTPSDELRIPFWPRDLYLLNAQGNPANTEGVVRASQRGMNTAIAYLSLTQPKFGSLLYFQNLTALNDYFLATETRPDGVVGGEWPELGYQPQIGSNPLPAGKEIIVSDAFVHWSPELPKDPRESARLFLDLLAGIYAHLERPESLYHDWPKRAKETLRDLENAPEATEKHFGRRYLHPYTDAEYPDSMVELTVLRPLLDYSAWKQTPIPLADELRAGLKHFFDPKIGTMRRYLPSVGKDKDPNEVDSWYLYHPLANLGRLARDGDDGARKMFFDSLDYGIEVAHHFKYQWPVQFNVQTLEVITGPRKPGDPGQSDAGGLFAYVMLQAYDLTQDVRYLKEAKAAIKALSNMEFELEYQANITAWGANACLRLWQITGDGEYRQQSHVFIASFFHNSLFWQSRLGAAQHYPIFLGVTCLHDGPYMALYECFEAFEAFHEYLTWIDGDVRDSVRLLLSEYCKYTPSRAWFYYPMELPKEDIATEVRNGHIDRNLAFPMEDLYADGQPAGQVGQEIYGCGAAFAFVTRSYHRLKAPFTLYCEYPIFELAEWDSSRVTFQTRGLSGFSCRARLIPTGRKPLPHVTIRLEADPKTRIHYRTTDEGHIEFEAPADQRIEILWTVPEG